MLYWVALAVAKNDPDHIDAVCNQPFIVFCDRHVLVSNRIERTWGLCGLGEFPRHQYPRVSPRHNKWANVTTATTPPNGHQGTWKSMMTDYVTVGWSRLDKRLRRRRC